MRNHALLICLLLLISGCGRSGLKYSVTVPESVPQEVTLHPKFDPEYKADARALYREAHRRGWDECIRNFQEGHLKQDSKPSIKQQYGLQQDAEIDGYEQCKKAIFRLIETRGEECVRKDLN